MNRLCWLALIVRSIFLEGCHCEKLFLDKFSLAVFRKNEHSPTAIELCGSTNTPKPRTDCEVFHGTIPEERHAVLRQSHSHARPRTERSPCEVKSRYSSVKRQGKNISQPLGVPWFGAKRHFYGVVPTLMAVRRSNRWKNIGRQTLYCWNAVKRSLRSVTEWSGIIDAVARPNAGRERV